MIVEALQFQAERAQGAGPGGNLDPGRPFDRMAESRRVRKTGIAGNALGQADPMRDGQAFEQFLDALVHIKHPELEIEHRFARDAEQKMAGLDDAGVHRADGHLEDAFALDLAKLVPLAGERRQPGLPVEILPQRMNLRPVVVQRAAARIRVADQLEAEQVLDLAFLPVDGVHGIGQRDELRPLRRDRHPHKHEAVRGIQRVEMVDEEHLVPGPRVLRKHAGQPPVVFPVDRGAEGAGQLLRRVQMKFVRLRRGRGCDLRAESLRQLLEDGPQGGQQVHGVRFWRRKNLIGGGSDFFMALRE